MKTRMLTSLWGECRLGVIINPMNVHDWCMHDIDVRRVDLNLLVTLDALLAERSVTRAAARLGVTQPAVSHALGRLREMLGDPLLLRSGREMELTPRAEALAEPLA